MLNNIIANIASQFNITLDQAKIVVDTAVEHLAVKHNVTTECVAENVGVHINLTKQFIDLTVIGVQTVLAA